MATELHIGRLLQQKLRDDERSVTWLALKLNCSRTNIYLMFKKQYIDSEMLMRLSIVMKFDFFECLSREYKIRLKSINAENKQPFKP